MNDFGPEAWWPVVFGATWILGVSLVVAAASVAYATAAHDGVSTWRRLREPRYWLAVCAGLVLLGLGALGAVHAWPERAAWALVALYFGWSAQHTARSLRRG